MATLTLRCTALARNAAHRPVTLRRSRSESAAPLQRAACRAARLRTRAAAGAPSPPPPPSQEDDEEARLEALEARVRGVGAARRQPEAPPTINIRGQQPKKQPVTPLAERIKGKDAIEAAWIVWSGEEGVLWWASKISYALVFVLIGGWIAFRFIGPATGLYTLKAGITDIPL